MTKIVVFECFKAFPLFGMSAIERFHCISKFLIRNTQYFDRNTAILVIIYWNLKMFQYRSESPQVKRNLISSITNLVYELSNDLKPRILGNQEKLEMPQIWVETQSSPQSLFQKLKYQVFQKHVTIVFHKLIVEISEKYQKQLTSISREILVLNSGKPSFLL